MSFPSFTIKPLSPLELVPQDRPTGAFAELIEDSEKQVRPDWMMSAVTLSANGHSLLSIAKSLQKDVKAVSQVIQSPWAKEAVMSLVSQTFSGEAEIKTIKHAAKDAVTTLQELMVSGPPQVRLAACKEILDRALGKPAQKVQHFAAEGKMDVRDEIEQLRKELNIQ